MINRILAANILKAGRDAGLQFFTVFYWGGVDFFIRVDVSLNAFLSLDFHSRNWGDRLEKEVGQYCFASSI